MIFPQVYLYIFCINKREIAGCIHVINIHDYTNVYIIYDIHTAFKSIKISSSIHLDIYTNINYAVQSIYTYYKVHKTYNKIMFCESMIFVQVNKKKSVYNIQKKLIEQINK